jgi:hypothetical protein
LGSNFFIAFFASEGLLTCIGVGKNATNHLKGSKKVQNPCQHWPKMPILHCKLGYSTLSNMAAFGDILYPFEQFLIVIGTKTDDFDPQRTTASIVKI